MKKPFIPRADKILQKLYRVILERSESLPSNSYVAALLQQGRERIHAKISEEAQEVIAASSEASREQLIHEMADLWFHCLVLLGYWQVPPDDIYTELARRFGHPGLKNKISPKMHGNE